MEGVNGVDNMHGSKSVGVSGLHHTSQLLKLVAAFSSFITHCSLKRRLTSKKRYCCFHYKDVYMLFRCCKCAQICNDSESVRLKYSLFRL